MMTDPEHAMFETLGRQICRSIDYLTTTVDEVARRLEVALGGLEVEVAQIREEVSDMAKSLVALEELADIHETLKGTDDDEPL
jgi:hypothetical protein